MTTTRALTLRSMVWPIMLELLLQYLIGTVDTLMVSRISDDAVAVVGISNQFFSTAILLFATINSEAGVLIAQKLGAAKHREASRTTAMSLALTAALGIVLSVLLH